MAKKEKSLFRQLLGERGVKDLAGVHALVKELTSDFIQEAMDAELEEELGYSKYDYKNKQTTDNSRNGISSIKDKIIFLYSQGVSTRDIEKTMQEMYGIEVDATRVSKITDKLLPVIREWPAIYPVRRRGYCPETSFLLIAPHPHPPRRGRDYIVFLASPPGGEVWSEGC